MHLVFWPIFDPQPYIKGEHPIPHSFSVDTQSIITNENEIDLIDSSSGDKIHLTKINDEINVQKYEKWKEDSEFLIIDGVLQGMMMISLFQNYESCYRNFHGM
jgi:hypothetical protein